MFSTSTRRGPGARYFGFISSRMISASRPVFAPDDLRFARRGDVGQFGLAIGIQQGQPRDAIRRTAQHFHGDDATHRQACQGKGLGRRRQHGPRHLLDGFVPGQRHDLHWRVRRQRDDLRQEQARIAHQAGKQDKGKGAGHGWAGTLMFRGSLLVRV